MSNRYAVLYLLLLAGIGCSQTNQHTPAPPPTTAPAPIPYEVIEHREHHQLGLAFLKRLELRQEVKDPIEASIAQAQKLNAEMIAQARNGEEVDEGLLPPISDSFYVGFDRFATAEERRYLLSAHGSPQWIAFRLLAKLRASAECYGPPAPTHPANDVLAKLETMLPSLANQRLSKEETVKVNAQLRTKYEEFVRQLSEKDDRVAREMISRLSREADWLTVKRRE